MTFIKEKNIEHLEKVKKLEAEVTKLKSAIEELTVLNELAFAAGSAMDIDRLLNVIVQKSIKATKAEQGSIMLVTPKEESPLHTLIRREAHTRMIPSYKVGSYVTGWVLKNRNSLMIENLAEDDRFQTTEQEQKEVRTVLCVPIWLKGEIIGVFTLTNKKSGESFNSNDLRLASIISAQSAQLIHNLNLHEEIIEKERLVLELLLARRIQLSLLPIEEPHNEYFEIASYFNPADSVGGDYYDYFDLGENKLGIVMADVSGHGPAAALIMTMIKGIIHSILANFTSADTTLTEINSIFNRIAPDETFVTLVLLIFDFPNNILQISNAGHHPVLRYNSKSDRMETLELKGCAINLSSSSKFLLKEIQINNDDIFCIYTDGIVEAENKEYNLFGIDRLIQVIEGARSESSKNIISDITNELDEFTNNTSQSDDIAIITLKVKDQFSQKLE